MKKINDNQIFALLLVLAIAIFLVVYFVPFKNTNEKIASLEKQNKSLTSEISSLQDYHDNKAQYQSDTETLRKEIVQIVSSYPSAYREEDFILEGIAMENASDHLQYKTLNFNEAESLAVIEADEMQSAEIDGYTDRIEFIKKRVDYNMEVDYPSLKAALAEAFASGYKANVESVVFTKDEAGVVLDGTITLGYYYVTGNGNPYKAPFIEPYEPGTNNIFLGGKSIDMGEFFESQE